MIDAKSALLSPAQPNAEPRVSVTCGSCGVPGRANSSQAHGWLCADCRPHAAALPAARSVHWPTLVSSCERLGIPVSRIDDLGQAHIIRTTKQLHAEWH